MLQSGDFRTERHFFQAFMERVKYPYYFLGLEAASPKLDALGVDALAEIKYPGGDIVQVPVEVKTGAERIIEYYRNHPQALGARVILLEVRRNSRFAEIHKYFFQQVEQRRIANIRFDAYLDKLEKWPVDRGLARIIAEIEARRSLGEPVTPLQAAE